NEILNGKAGGINSLDDLIGNGVVEGVNNFNELKDFTKEMLRDKMSGGIIKGLNKGCSPLESLLLLSSVDTMEQFKKTRFQLHYTKGVEDSLKKDYGSLKNLLESVGIDSIDEVKEDYISLVADTVPLGHAFSVILDIKKMKELVKETGKDLDEAVSSKKVIHCFDSARVLGDSLVTEDETYRDMGALTKNCDFVNLMQQDLGSCWFHAVASTLTAMKHPELVQRIRNGEIELYDIEHILIRDSDKLNEFQFRQMNTIIEISKKFNIELTDDNRAAIDLTIYDKMQEKVEETVPDITRIVLGSALDNKIREQTKNNKSGEAFRRRQEEKLRTNFTREKGESDFAYRVRFEDKVSEEANKHRKALDIRKDDIEKLKAEKNPILYKGKSADDSLFIDMKFTNKIKTIKTIESLDGTCEPRENIFPPFGDRKKLSSFRERERAKNNSKIEREV
ncbi:MAG: hypothetical protein LBP39_02130, partial [Rickettsiales bacterium]|nr:hypothetical protein [Rickettsiales bacterium]